jgi:hypothetical protein
VTEDEAAADERARAHQIAMALPSTELRTALYRWIAEASPFLRGLLLDLPPREAAGWFDVHEAVTSLQARKVADALAHYEAAVAEHNREHDALGCALAAFHARYAADSPPDPGPIDHTDTQRRARRHHRRTRPCPFSPPFPPLPS